MSQLVVLTDGSATIPVIGGELMGPQLIGFMQSALIDLALMDQVKTVMIRKEDNLINEEGTILRGMYDPLTLSIIISIGEIWDTALSISQQEERKTLSLRGLCHFLFSEVFLHECYHCQSHGSKGIDWIHDGEEPEAEEFAINWLCDMAKSFDLELPTDDNDGWFGTQIREWYSVVKDTDERMIKMHVDMYEKGVVWRDMYADLNYEHMRDYYRHVALDALDDKAWGSTKLVSVIPDKPADAETTVPVVPPPPFTPSSPTDDMESEEPVAIMIDEDDESGWDNVPDDDGIPTPTSVEPKVAAPDRPAVRTTHTDPPEIGINVPNIPVAEQTAVAKEVIARLFHHMFEKCGWTGSTWDETLVGSIREPILIDDVANVKEVFMGMNAEIGGKFRRFATITDRIIGDRGLKGAPKYELFMNANGKRVKRVISPVNMNTQSDAAQEMRDGKLVAWLMDGHIPNTEDSIIVKLSFDPKHSTEVEWTKWPENK